MAERRHLRLVPSERLTEDQTMAALIESASGKPQVEDLLLGLRESAPEIEEDDRG